MREDETLNCSIIRRIRKNNHNLMLRDPELHRQVMHLVSMRRHGAEFATQQVLERMAGMTALVAALVLAEGAADLRDLAMRLQSAADDQPFGDGARGFADSAGMRTME